MSNYLRPLDQGVGPQAAEDHYLEVFRELTTEAHACGRMDVLADVMAWTLARMVFACGLGSAGDLLRRLGNYLHRLDAQEAARQEAMRLAQSGHLPN